MTSQQIDNAMKNRTPVMYKGERYERIVEYAMWYDDKGNRKLSVVLFSGRYCLVRVPAEKVEEYNECRAD